MRNTKAQPPLAVVYFLCGSMDRVIVYIDGFNFYYGLKNKALKNKSWKKYYWIDLVALFEKMLIDSQYLEELHYFSARPHNIDASKRQDTLFCANKLNPKFKLTLGKYLKKSIVCKQCGSEIKTYEEKETDVRIATQIINDVYSDRCDISIIVSADSDIIPAIEVVRSIKPNHKIFVFFPPLRHSVDLKNICDFNLSLDRFETKFKQSVLPSKVILPSGVELLQPDNWK